MKALVYKEFKLAMHPICFIFMLAFPFMVLIPSYPSSIGFIYILTAYPILFLGANKGQQSNDLLFSTLLPVRKKDIVLSRIITVGIIQLTSIVVTGCLVPFSLMIQNNIANAAIASGGEAPIIPGLPLTGYLSIVGIVLVGFALTDLIFFPIYYKRGRSIVASTLFSILFFTVYLLLFTIFPGILPQLANVKVFLCENGIGPQLIVLAVGVILYAAIHYLVYRIASRNLEKVDF